MSSELSTASLHRSVHDDVSVRHSSPYTLKEKVGRVIWSVLQPTLFRWSPRPAWRWRNWLLRRFGASISPTARIHPTTKITIPWNLSIGDNSSVGDAAILYALGPLKIGDRATISQYAHLCGGTHDYRQSHMPLIRSTIQVGDDVWIAAAAFIGPDVTINAGAIVGARSVVVNDVPGETVVGGNPAKILKAR